MAKKITHDIVCNTCGKPATINLCNVWEKYDIEPNGDYSDQVDSWEGDGNIDVCDKCYDKGDF